MQTKIKLKQGETLKLESSKTKGFKGETDESIYSVIDAAGMVVGSVVHIDHTAIRGLRRRQSVIQKDQAGNVIVDESW